MSTSITPDTQSLMQELITAMQSGSLSSGTGSTNGAGQSDGTQNTQEEAKLAEVFQELMALLKQGNQEGSASPGSDTASPAISAATGSSASATPSQDLRRPQLRPRATHPALLRQPLARLVSVRETAPIPPPSPIPAITMRKLASFSTAGPRPNLQLRSTSNPARPAH